MKHICSLVALFVLTIYCKHLWAQCSAPSAIGTPVVTHASCPGNGRIIVNSVSPALVAPEYYQYALYQSATEIKPWQNSDTFLDVNAGTYEIRVRKVCSTGFSNVITRSVTVNNVEAVPAISSITVNRHAKCNNGRFTVVATGAPPLQYAIVPALTEPEPTTNYIRPKQSASVFDSLPAGTYYVRVYNACNNAVTQAVTIPAYTAVTSIDIQSVAPMSCDSFILNFRINNYLNIFNTRDTALSKWWINWPTGITDTMPAPTTLASGTNILSEGLFPYSRLSASVSGGSFPDNLGGWPFTITGGFRDACGNIYLDTLVINKPTTRTLNLLSYENTLSSCDSVAYNFSITYTPNLGIGITYHYFTNTNEIMFSLDNGLTWRQVRTSAGKSIYSDYFLWPRNTPATIKVAICGDTLTQTLTTASLPPLQITLSEYNLYSCLGKTGTSVTSTNVKGTSIGISMTSAPAGQPLIPYFETPISVNSARYPIPLQNLLPGTYNFTFYDTIGVDCPRQVTRSVTLSVPATLAGNVERQCNGDLWMRSSNTYRLGTNNIAIGPVLKAELFNSAGVKVLPSGTNTYSGSTAIQTGYTTVVIPSSGLNALPDGDYILKIKKQASGYPYLDTCTVVEIPWSKGNNALNLDPSQFIAGCPAGSATIVAVAQGGKTPYTFTLRNAANNTVTPTSGNNIYNNLVSNATYTLQVIDACGTVVNRTLSVSGSIAMFATSNGPEVCEGDSATLRVYDMPGVTYQWQKNGTNITGEDSAVLMFNVVTFPQDSGAYRVAVSMGTCVVFTSAFNLTPGSCTPLPVKLLAFTAHVQGNKALLAWTTASEQNNKGFYIERNTGGRNWDAIHFVQSKAKSGNSSGKLDYTYTDESAGNVPVYYYRLKQVDFEGIADYSEVQRVSFNHSGLYQLSPNPAKHRVTVTGLKGGEHISIYNSLGSLVQTVQVLRGGTQQLDIKLLIPGLYVMHIRDNEGQGEYIKLIVQ